MRGLRRFEHTLSLSRPSERDILLVVRDSGFCVSFVGIIIGHSPVSYVPVKPARTPSPTHLLGIFTHLSDRVTVKGGGILRSMSLYIGSEE